MASQYPDMNHSAPSAESDQPQRPPLPSPRLFRNYRPDFTTLPSLTDLDLTSLDLPPMNYSETMRDVADAINNADTALRNAQEAFRNASSMSRHSIVDLTGTSPDEDHDDTFISHTRHPHDASGGRAAASTSLHEPAYGPRSSPPSTFTDIYNSITSDPSTHAPPARPIQPSRWYGPVALATMPPRRDITRRAEETAIRRQRQLHRDWQRVQDRNRRRAEEQAARDAEAQIEREAARLRQAIEHEEAHLTTNTLTTNDHSRHRQRRRPSNASTNSSLSDMSSFSVSTTSTSYQADSTQPEMNSIDLTQVNSDKTLSQVLAKEQQDAIALQNNIPTSTTFTNPKATALSSYKCAICMDSPTDATTTKCGHLFCHRCVVDALKHSKSTRSQEAQAHGRRGVQSGLCPVCRTPLQDKDAGPSRGLIPLEIKKVPRGVYEKRQREKNGETEGVETVDKGKEKAKEEPGDIHALFKNEEDDTFSLESSSKAKSSMSRKKRKRPLTDEEIDQDLFGEAFADSA
ncbi:hypothetical protein H2198_010054 [Neophaeococcomyces mojaviensis]|uniref:Uncharacterized protein n=1 Tax=Neophaeococcomyces mojaviensis TaxID=3383035 RepID=A0ACC2ZT29_9EURO|nr:hypothetical protein H2198_010054 [Knufia sp. JES_112]